MELNSTLPPSLGQRLIPHTLTDAKIISVTAMVTDGSNQIPPNVPFNGMLYSVYIYNGQVVLQTGDAASSISAYNKPIRLFIIYKE